MAIDEGSEAPETPVEDSTATAALSASLLAESAKAQVDSTTDPILETSDLPGVGSEAETLRDGLRKGGYRIFLTLLVLNSFDELESSAVAILGPDIGESFGISDGTVTAIITAGLLFFVLGAGPMGWLADRVRRGPLIGAAASVFATFTFLTGLAANAFIFFCLRFVSGVSKSNTISVHPSLLADTYPIHTRGRLFAAHQGAGRFFNLAVGPVVAGGIAVWIGGDDSWRWAFFLVGIPVLLVGLSAFTMREPKRGQWEKNAVLGDEHSIDDSKVAISAEAAFARIWGIWTVRNMTVALAAIGFALFPARSIESFFLEEEYGLDALQRGLAVAPGGVALLIALPVFGRLFDRRFVQDPEDALRIVGYLLVPVGFLVMIQYSVPSLGLFIAFGTVAGTLLGTAVALLQPTLQAVFPYRLRGTGTAIVTLILVAIGGVGGSVVAGFLQDEFGERWAIVLITMLAMPLGSAFILRGASKVRHDLSVIVAELKQEEIEFKRKTDNPESIPALQVSNVDFSYGQVQVLFDLSFEVMPGEALAVIGNNGAGKTTAFGVVSGLLVPTRGVVRLNGETVTFSSPEYRAEKGIHMLPGGSGVWPTLSIDDNMRLAADRYRRDRHDQQRRIEEALSLFPAVAERRKSKARELSGGMQQQLALARVMLHEPEVLLIDELSLGLAPVVVESLLEVIDRLRAEGQTMIIVEQSVNIALSIADRAVVMEKGRVFYEGTSAELAADPQFAEAVLLRGDK